MIPLTIFRIIFNPFLKLFSTILDFLLWQPSLLCKSPTPLFLAIFSHLELILQVFSLFGASNLLQVAVIILVGLVKLIFDLLFLIRIGLWHKEIGACVKIPPISLFIAGPNRKPNQPFKNQSSLQIRSSSLVHV